MIRALRKRHLQVWTVWAIVLPIAIATAWLSVPRQVSQPLLQPPAKAALPSNIYIDTTNHLQLKP